MSIARKAELVIKKDLEEKMVFLSGPRQCGKTTLAESLLKEYAGQYYNWDVSKDRKKILNDDLNLDAKLWVFDELHKFRRWRNFLKGVFDEHHKEHALFVTGSARLELYGRGGDSLQGRYFSHHLHPLTLGEVCGTPPILEIDQWLNFPNAIHKNTQEVLVQLLKLSGFPEPFLSGQEVEAHRWQLTYADRLIEEEIRSLEDVKEIDRLELLLDRLNAVAGSIISINSLRVSLDVSFDSVKKWIAIFERIFACFRISPFGPPKIKAVKKEQKLYLWDWSKAESEGARFENLIALHLLRFVDWARDIFGEKIDLRYFRHRDGSEVDFILLKKGKPWVAIEAKLQEQEISKPLQYYLQRVETPHAFQVFLNGGDEKTLAKIGNTTVRSVSAARFLLQLP